MKLLFLIYDHPANPWVGGGGAVRVHEIGKRLARMGHSVTIISGDFPGAEKVEPEGYECRFLGSRESYLKSTFAYAWEAMKFVRRVGGSYDLVIEDYAPWNPVFSSLATKTPTVLHVNHREGLNILKRHKLAGIPFYILDLFYHRLFKRMTALSEGTRQKFSRPDAHIVPAGVDEALSQSRALDIAERGDYILYLGRLEVYNKGLDTLMDALRLAPSVRLVMAGRGRDEARVRELAHGLDVEIKGFVTEQEKVGLLSRARLIVLPSRFEGWGIVLQEAAALGTPSIVSNIPELGFTLEHGFGQAFPVGDARALAARITELYADSATRAEMGRRGQAYVKGYTWQAIAEDLNRWLLSEVKR